MQAVEVKLVTLSLATGPAGSVIVCLNPAVNTLSTTGAGEAAEEDTAAPVLPGPFKPVERYVCAGNRTWAVFLIYRETCGRADSMQALLCTCWLLRALRTCLHQVLSVSHTLPAATCVAPSTLLQVL